MGRPSPILPRLIRLRDAPSYPGMECNKFNADVRPHLTEVPLDAQAIAFDRLELRSLGGCIYPMQRPLSESRTV